MDYYRNNAMSVPEMDQIVSVGTNTYEVCFICNVNFKILDREEYLQWLAVWKIAYNNISKIIRDVKNKQEERKYLYAYTRLANTLLNARKYAKDVRRRAEVASKE